MLKQEVSKSNINIHIPQIKRCTFYDHSFINSYSNHNIFSMEKSIQTLKHQSNEPSPLFQIRTQKSDFSKVLSSQEDGIDTLKLENTMTPFYIEEIQFYKVNLQKLIELIDKSQPQSQKQQKQFAFNTKNILRNICNAQNQYILFNASAQQIINRFIQNDIKFKSWVNKLRFHTFEQFQSVWNCKNQNLFKKLYKRLCRKFYIENAIPYIMNSRIKNKQTKLAHIRFLYRFLEGLQNPSNFFYFKQKEKL